MKYSLFVFNLRLVVFTILAFIAFAFLACDCDEAYDFFMTKFLGAALAYACWRISERMDSAWQVSNDGDMEV